MAVPFSVEGEKLFFGDLGKVGDGPNLSNRSYVFQVGGKGNNAAASATSTPNSGAASAIPAAVAQLSPYIPTIIVGLCVLIGAWLVFGGKKKGAS